MKMPKLDLYTRAHLRMERMGFDPQQLDFIFADWPEGDEHLSWLIHATRDEIIDWGEAGEWGVQP